MPYATLALSDELGTSDREVVVAGGDLLQWLWSCDATVAYCRDDLSISSSRLTAVVVGPSPSFM